MDDATILTERLRGRTLRDLADTTGLSPEGVRVVVAREGRKQIDEIELALLANTKTDDLQGGAVARAASQASSTRTSCPSPWASHNAARA